MTSSEIEFRLKKLGDPAIAKVSQGFFKTGPGEYGEGDVFVGIRVPTLRKLAREYSETPWPEVLSLLQSSIHEVRLLALLIWVRQFSSGDESTQKEIYRQYLKHTNRVNNWDLVDLSAEHIMGPYLWERSKQPLYRFAKSKILWERRIAILSTFHYIKQGKFKETLKISEMLLGDKEDLIHKAVGWMLREIGKRDRKTEEAFLKKYCHRMPRTMLRYAIERFSEKERQKYLGAQTFDRSRLKRANFYGHSDVKNSVAYVQKIRKGSRNQSDKSFLKEIHRTGIRHDLRCGGRQLKLVKSFYRNFLGCINDLYGHDLIFTSRV